MTPWWRRTLRAHLQWRGALEWRSRAERRVDAQVGRTPSRVSMWLLKRSRLRKISWCEQQQSLRCRAAHSLSCVSFCFSYFRKQTMSRADAKQEFVITRPLKVHSSTNISNTSSRRTPTYNVSCLFICYSRHCTINFLFVFFTKASYLQHVFPELK